MSNNFYTAFLSQTGGSVLIVVGLFILLLVSTWITSILAGFRSKRGEDLRLLLAFPLTNPVALAILAFRDFAAALLPVVLWLLTILCLPVGGWIAERFEKARLNAVERSYAEAGEPLDTSSLVADPVPASENVWDHPFMVPLTRQRQASSEVGQTHAIRVPIADQREIKYARDEKQRGQRKTRLALDPFFYLHRTALATERGRELLSKGEAPESWGACGQLVLLHYEPAAADFSALAEAVARPKDRYPFAWEKGASIPLPYLVTMKIWTQSAAYRSMAWATTGEPAAALRDLLLAFKLVRTGHSDLLISRLVQMAQASTCLSAIQVAQQYHLWTDAEWAEIQGQLRLLDFPGAMPDCMRTERVVGYQSVKELLGKSATEIATSLTRTYNFEANPGQEQRNGAMAIVDFFVTGLARAALCQQLRLYLKAQADAIEAVEKVKDQSLVRPWSEIRTTAGMPTQNTHGYLADLLIPSLHSIERALDSQLKISLAMVACALERYYLEHNEYPQTLEMLAPTYVKKSDLMDPIVDEPWRYQRSGRKAFFLYSIGWNGADEAGLSHGMGYRGPGQDDVAWRISEELPQLPEFNYQPRNAR